MYPSGLPLLSLDHIYCDPQFHLEDAHFHRSGTALIASDHLPLVADLSIDKMPGQAAAYAARRTSLELALQSC